MQDILDFISKGKPDILNNHEMKLPKQSNFNIQHSNSLIEEEHVNFRAHEKVAILVHETIPHKTNSPLHSPTSSYNYIEH